MLMISVLGVGVGVGVDGTEEGTRGKLRISYFEEFSYGAY